MFQPFYNGHHQCVDDDKVKTICPEELVNDRAITK